MKDIDIRAEILRELDREQIVDCTSVQVRVHRGQVTLAGCVETAAQRSMAENAARTTAGVRRIVNLIEAPTGAQRRRDEALAKRIRQVLDSPLVEGDAIEAQVLNGNVTLTGWVDRDSRRRTAETEVLCLPGVKDVRSRVAVALPPPVIDQSARTLMGKALGG